MSFTKELQNHLRKMGWQDGRIIGKYDAYIKQYNYPEFIRDFVREYGGLRIKDLNVDGHLKDNYRTNLDLFESDGMATESVASDWAKSLGRKLYVIGLYSPENFDIAVDENGALFLLGQELYCLGKDIYKGIESIIRMDNTSTIQLSPEKDYKSGIWHNNNNEPTDFDSYEFKYSKFTS